MHKLLRTLALLMAAMLVVFMVGCGDDDDDDVMANDDDDDPVAAPSATSVSANPAAGAEIPQNAVLNLTLDQDVDSVSVEGSAATGSDKSWTFDITPLNLDGPATLSVTWKNKDGSDGGPQSLSYTVTVPDTKAPAIDGGGSTVTNGAADVDPAPLNAGGITIKFDEAITAGTASMTTGGAPVNWTWAVSGDTAVGTLIAGAELANETQYDINISGVTDAAGNTLPDTVVSFTTKAK